ncbi:MAG: hypothetical protein DCC75_08710 [Proteobacteria bacterium]|nr:MAG: hypothetical protein DCC75_08710 [Pseudomonadota bacterium]
MVTAGVYLLGRMHFLFSLAPYAMMIVVVIAVLTALIAATIALTQHDIKKVLAYSTVSQLGFMFMAAGAGAYWVAIFHLVTHAFFKACLFLGAGTVIHGCHHEQDMRHMGGLLKKMPITAATYGFATLAIAGIAPFAGYYSKHGIMLALEQNTNPYLGTLTAILVALATLTAFFTAFYMTRSFAMTFLGEYRGHAHPHESPPNMTIVLAVLALLSIAGGYMLAGPWSLEHYLSHAIPVHGEHEHETLLASILHSGWGIFGVLLGLVLYTKAKQVPGLVYQALLPLGKLSSAKYYVDEIYGALIVRPLEFLAKMLWKGIDQMLIDGVVNGTAEAIDMSAETVRYVQTGQTRHYAFFMMVGTIVVIFFYMVL